MFDAFNAQAKTLGDLLSDNQPAKVVVPRFQRGYSWEKKHVEAFWNDITAFRKESAKKGGPDKYFLGPIVILQTTKEAIELLDGQQRLATATILLSSLRDAAATLGIEDGTIFAADIHSHFITKEDVGFGLELGELDKAYFAQVVQAYPVTPTKPKLRSHRNIQSAREFLSAALAQSVSGMSPADALAEFRSIRKTLRTELVMASIPVSSQRDAFKIFETLNDRGLRLSTPDLLLNYLMGSAATDQDRNLIRELWNDMIEAMGRRDINRFIRHMWVSKYGDLKSKDLFSALKDRIQDEKLTPVQFAQSCSQECERYVDLLKADPEELESAARAVRSLVRDLGFEPTLPVLMSASAVLPSRSDLDKVARWLLVFVTRYSIIVGLDASGMENTLFALARDVREKAAAGASPKECLSLVKDRLMKNSPTDDLVESRLVTKQFEQQEAVYVVSRIANRMQSATKELVLGESNLEHIFPKKPSNEWENPSDLEPFLWNIGNLTMLGKRLNNAAAASEFTAKKNEYKKSNLKITQNIADNYSAWDEKAILKRASSMVPLVKEIWSFANPSRV